MRHVFILAFLILSGCADLAPPHSWQEESDTQPTVQDAKGAKAQSAAHTWFGLKRTDNQASVPATNSQKELSRQPDGRNKAAQDTSKANEPECESCLPTWWPAAAIGLVLIMLWALDNGKAEPKAASGDSKDHDAHQEIQALTKLVAAKTREMEALAAKLKDRRDLKILQRIGQFQHALDFNRKLMLAGKLDAAGAIKEIEAELEAALDELGIAPFTIEIGTKVRDLPEGSFELIDGVKPPSADLAGTVCKVRQRALVYKDAAGLTHFLIPAKIDAYKL